MNFLATAAEQSEHIIEVAEDGLLEQIDIYIAGLVGAVASFLGIKVKDFSLKRAVKKSIDLTENLGELSNKPISEIVRDELNAFSKEHLDCHRRIEGELTDIKTSLANIEGRLAQPGG